MSSINQRRYVIRKLAHSIMEKARAAHTAALDAANEKNKVVFEAAAKQAFAAGTLKYSCSRGQLVTFELPKKPKTVTVEGASLKLQIEQGPINLLVPKTLEAKYMAAKIAIEKLETELVFADAEELKKQFTAVEKLINKL